MAVDHPLTLSFFITDLLVRFNIDLTWPRASLGQELQNLSSIIWVSYLQDHRISRVSKRIYLGTPTKPQTCIRSSSCTTGKENHNFQSDFYASWDDSLVWLPRTDTDIDQPNVLDECITPSRSRTQGTWNSISYALSAVGQGSTGIVCLSLGFIP